jgi:hypothetical protein
MFFIVSLLFAFSNAVFLFPKLNLVFSSIFLFYGLSFFLFLRFLEPFPVFSPIFWPYFASYLSMFPNQLWVVFYADWFCLILEFSFTSPIKLVAIIYLVPLLLARVVRKVSFSHFFDTFFLFGPSTLAAFVMRLCGLVFFQVNAYVEAPWKFGSDRLAVGCALVTCSAQTLSKNSFLCVLRKKKTHWVYPTVNFNNFSSYDPFLLIVTDSEFCIH